jgi:hypothetical protein
VLRRYRHDRFVRPGSIPWRSLRRAEDLLLGALPADVEVLNLAPLVPLGTHSALGTVSQDKVVTAIRACEVAADPTNALALEAADRRARAPGQTVRLAAVQRMVRAQHTEGAGYFAHFSLLGLVTAGRDAGGYQFQRRAVAEQLACAARGLAAAGVGEIQVALTPLSETGELVAAGVAAEPPPGPVQVVLDRDRQSGRGYYTDLCFKLNAQAGSEPVELGDGGFTDWGQKLTASRKERLLISGIGIDRLATLIGAW